MGKGILSVLKRFLFILAAVESFSQVIIREKVEIEPYDIHPGASVSRDHSVTFEMSWSNPEACCNIRITAACGEILNSGWTCSGFTSITINPIKGSRLEWLFEYEGDFPLNHTKKIIYDDQPPVILPFNAWGASMVFNSLYQLKFDLEGVCVVTPKIIHTGTADCNSRIWVHSDSITFTITEGNDYVSFYNSETWELYGNSVSCLSDDLWQIAIIQDKKHADSGDIPVKVFSG